MAWFFVILFTAATLFGGVAIAYVTGAAAVLSFVAADSAQYLAILPQRVLSQLDVFTFLAMPLFILAGELMTRGGITKALIDLAMLIVGRLLNRFDLRIFIISGLLVAAYATWDMTTFTLDVSLQRLLVNGFIQGFGLGLLFVSLTTVTFSTLQAALRPEGTGIYALLRNLGSSIGISMVVAVLTHQTDAGVIELSWRANFDAEQVSETLAAGGSTVDRLQAISVIHNELVRQAGMIAYLDDFTLLFWLTLLPIPLVLLIRRRRFDAT